MSEEKKEAKKLEIPEFKSDIPEHLLNNCSDQDKYIMEQLSIQKQQNSWIITTVTDVHYHQQITNGRVNSNSERLDNLEEPKKLLSSKPMKIACGIILFTFLFVAYPYFLTLEFKDLLPLVKTFFV